MKSTEYTKKLNRIGFYRNSIGRCSSHAERFSILLSNISLNMNRMNNICALNSFDLKCVEYYVWFYFILLCFFISCVDKLTTETTTAPVKTLNKTTNFCWFDKTFREYKGKMGTKRIYLFDFGCVLLVCCFMDICTD